VYAGLGGVLWLIPLFNVLHAESSAVVAGVAFFASGLTSIPLFERGAAWRAVLVRQVAALLIPWFLLTCTLLWIPNCGYGQGLLFFLLFAPPGVVLAVALAYAISGTRRRFKKGLFAGIGLVVLIVTPLYDLGLHPQFYLYNHVFGAVLGPIYDEELVIRPGLLFFRALTGLWALLAWMVGRRWWLRRDGLPAPVRVWHAGSLAGIVVVVLGLGGVYMGAVPLGINTAPWYIQRTLGGRYQTEHFDLYYDPASLRADEVAFLAEDHEFRYTQLARRLEVQVADRIASYLYPDAETKARLTGARTTNVAPVWLPRPQVHVLLDAYDRVFAHELAHVFSRAFGMPVFRASPAVGLVEGLAVAVEPPDGLPTPHEQVAAAALHRYAADPTKPPDLASDLAARLAPLGFWTGRGAVSYTTMGSFVRYLLDVYGPGPFKRVYARARFEAVYGKSVAVLAQEWQQYVLARPVVDRTTGAFVSARFSVPSLFEKPCPHYVPPYRRLYGQGLEALVAEDTTRALVAFDAAVRRQPAYEPALAAWALGKLAYEDPEAVVARLDTMALDRLTPALAVRLGDAYALLGRPVLARMHYDVALRRLPAYAYEQIALVVMRKSLAAEPKILHIVTASGSPEARAQALADYAAQTPRAGVLAALYEAEAGRFEQASERLRTTSFPDEATASLYHRRLLRWQRLIWLARWYYRAGDPEAAGAYAREAAHAFETVGAFNVAALLRDFHEKMVWVRDTR